MGSSLCVQRIARPFGQTPKLRVLCSQVRRCLQLLYLMEYLLRRGYSPLLAAAREYQALYRFAARIAHLFGDTAAFRHVVAVA